MDKQHPLFELKSIHQKEHELFLCNLLLMENISMKQQFYILEIGENEINNILGLSVAFAKFRKIHRDCSDRFDIALRQYGCDTDIKDPHLLKKFEANFKKEAFLCFEDCRESSRKIFNELVKAFWRLHIIPACCMETPGFCSRLHRHGRRESKDFCRFMVWFGVILGFLIIFWYTMFWAVSN